jgi:hypothetical protein
VGPGWPDDAVERARARVGRALFGARADVRPIVGRFEIDGVMPPPGVSARFVATDPITAGKVVLQFVADAPTEGARRMTAQACASLHHPNVMPVTEVIEHGGAMVLVMQRVHAETLRAWVERRLRSVRDVVHAHLGAALGLAAAHAVGLVHRSFGANAIVREPGGRVRVLAADLVLEQGFEGIRRDVVAFCDALRGSMLLSAVDGSQVDRVHTVLDRWGRTGRGIDLGQLHTELLLSLREAAAYRTRT